MSSALTTPADPRCSNTEPPPSSSSYNADIAKKKRRPAGTPDPDAEVVSLSPRTLLESDRFVCEICHQGFQRDQNLQMHRRRHKVPWKLLKREVAEVRKRVFVCPEPMCLHHDPCHALGDLVGIKKHFRRKHSCQRQWVCAKCAKGYAVQSDYKAHLKTCGTRGHSCDCGRVFSRVESFIEHQDSCKASQAPAESLPPQSAASLSRTTPSSSPSTDTNFSHAMWIGMRFQSQSIILNQQQQPVSKTQWPLVDSCDNKISELQLLPTCENPPVFLSSVTFSQQTDEIQATKLKLSLGPSDEDCSFRGQEPAMVSSRLNDRDVIEHLRLAEAEKKIANDARQQAKMQIELAEQEFANAKRIRQQAQIELERVHAIRDNAVKQIDSMLSEITCYACKKQFRASPIVIPDENSIAASYMSSVVTEGDQENDMNISRH